MQMRKPKLLDLFCGAGGAGMGYAHTNSSAGYSSFKNGATHISTTGNNFRLADAKIAMGIDWMRTRQEISQAIPPAYTRWIGEQLLAISDPKRLWAIKSMGQ